jgi:Tfp pilus assembly protein FimT
MAEEETTVLHTLLELLVVIALINVSITVSLSA